ncbi:RNase III inhibitor [Aquisphaera giovannonii]|uniref:RNase III inhibitor n=1 Tax=Aquisphaera giovannonii TaxID=406548 RepID=A0A5B9WFS8_9BACT|nr:macro domain-containing protein [Aquisphaera giovannonii]QEH38865.1 RNase III inhibitor [Aquisphaera giovannonii]
MVHTVLAKFRRWRMTTLKPFGDPASPEGVRLTLGDRDGGVARALAAAFGGVPAVEVVEGDLLDADCEAIVSPANSFGDMGGGIDKAIDDFHRGAAQRAVMDAIAEHFYGELPVGMAVVVELPGRRLPFVVASPTMRVPGRVPHSLNAYLAMRAALVAVLRHNAAARRPIRALAVPGLCTGVGAMPAAEAAMQMRTAYDIVMGGHWRRVVHPAMAPYAMRP